MRTTIPDDPLVKALKVGQYLAWEGDVLKFALGRPAAFDYSLYLGSKMRVAGAPPGFQPRPAGREYAWLNDWSVLTLPIDAVDPTGR